MSGAKKSTWIGGTVFIAVVIMAAAWFLAISPTMASAADIRAETEQVEQQNELLELQLAKLESDFAKLPEYKAQLADLQLKIPQKALLADYIRQLDAIAVAHEVTLTAITPAPALTVTVAADPAAVAPAPAPAADGAEASSTPPAEGAAEPAVVAPVPAGAPAGLAAIPFSLTALGTYDNTMAFLYDLQNATPRLFLVSGFTGTSQKQADASAGKPATTDGDQELVITGFTYVLPDAFAVPATVDPAAPPAALPGAVPGKNPLMPIPGH